MFILTTPTAADKKSNVDNSAVVLDASDNGAIKTIDIVVDDSSRRAGSIGGGNGAAEVVRIPQADGSVAWYVRGLGGDADVGDLKLEVNGPSVIFGRGVDTISGELPGHSFTTLQSAPTVKGLSRVAGGIALVQNQGRGETPQIVVKSINKNPLAVMTRSKTAPYPAHLQGGVQEGED